MSAGIDLQYLVQDARLEAAQLRILNGEQDELIAQLRRELEARKGAAAERDRLAVERNALELSVVAKEERLVLVERMLEAARVQLNARSLELERLQAELALKKAGR